MPERPVAMTTTQRRRRRAPSSERTRDEIIRGAAALFERKGYRGTSIRDIARQTDASISNIYHHFGNKEGLWQEIQDVTVRQFPDKLRQALAGIRDPARRMRTLLRKHLESAEEFRRETRMFFLNNDQLDPSRDRGNRRIQREILDIYVAELEALRRLGKLASRHPTIVAFNIFGVVNWVLRWYRSDGPLGTAQVHDDIVAFLLRGIGLSRGR
jgi:AcrR family transcriptional regulator